MQLDIFEHSRDVMLRNDVVQALVCREAAAGHSAWRALAEEAPDDDMLVPLALLLDALERPADSSFRDRDALRDARRVLSAEVLPAALTVFGEIGGREWLRPLWRQCAQRAARLAFRADSSDDHAAPLLLCAGDWQVAADAVARIESWRRIPAPLAWMAEARYRTDGLDAIWALLAELAWLSPARFDDLARRLADPSMDKLRKRFDATFEGDSDVADLAWFPAWLLIEKPGLANLLGQAQASRHDAPEEALRLLLMLLGLERQGRHHELVERRKALRDLHPQLYAAYMSTR